MKKLDGLSDENLKVVKEEEQVKKTPMEEGKEFIEGFVDVLKSRKKFVIFLLDDLMLVRANYLINELESFLKDFDGKKISDIKKWKKVCKQFVDDFEGDLKKREEEQLENLRDAMGALIEFKELSDGINLGEELVIWNPSNAAYLDMMRVVKGEDGLKTIYLKMVEIAETILAKNNIQ